MNERALSPREREVLVWLAHGYRQKEVAIRLGISYSTVKTMVLVACQKLHVHGTVEAFIALGWLRAPER